MLQTQNFIGNFNSIINALECIPLEILNIKLFSSSKLMDGRSIDGKKKFKLKKLIQFPRDIYNYNMYFLKTIFVIYPKKKKFYLHIALSHYFASMFILNIIFLKYSNNIYIYTHITYLFIFIHVLSNVQYIFWPYYTQLKIYYYFIHSYNYYKI